MEESGSGKAEYHAGDRVKMSGNGKVMNRDAMEQMGLKIGDTILAIDPESGMKKNGEDGIYFTVYEAEITRITRTTGIRTEETAHNYLRTDGLWSDDMDEEEKN